MICVWMRCCVLSDEKQSDCVALLVSVYMAEQDSKPNQKHHNSNSFVKLVHAEEKLQLPHNVI